MKTQPQPSLPKRLLPLAGVACVLLFSCMATPPSAVLAFDGGRVRAASEVEAERVEALMGRLRPEILDLLPDANFDDLEVWVQDRPSLYSFATEATADAEGLWSPTHRRIMLSRHADHLERTLAHELTHAALGPSWQLLPGSLEEGLADHVSAALCSDGAARLRAGRLSSACLATGGLEIDLDVNRVVPGEDSQAAMRRGWSARVRLRGDTQESDPLDVFRLSAGLSSTKLDTGAKRGFYGLAFLVVSEVVRLDGGYDTLHRLCTEAAADGRSTVGMHDVLDAAGLTEDVNDWRRAASRAMGEEEIVELIRMYPDFLVDALIDYITGIETESPTAALGQITVSVGLAEGISHVGLDQLPFVTEAVAAHFRSASAHR